MPTPFDYFALVLAPLGASFIAVEVLIHFLPPGELILSNPGQTSWAAAMDSSSDDALALERPAERISP
jgi:hypothetical protein